MLGGVVAALPALRGHAAAQDRIAAVATFSILGDFVKNVGGERVAVTTLVGPSGDVHAYTPTPGDAKAIAAARIVIVNGLGLEGWMTRLMAAAGSKAPVVVASAGVKPLEQSRRRASIGPDPHAWQSVANAKVYVANIRDGLSRVDPDGKPVYDANAAAYLAKLDALDGEVRQTIDKIPPARRRIITTHDAFGYFGAAYGLTFIAPEGITTEAEVSAKDIAAIIALIRTKKIPAVFMENVSDPRLIQEIAAETGAKVGGTLYSDALSPPGGPAATYIEAIGHNARELEKTLAG